MKKTYLLLYVCLALFVPTAPAFAGFVAAPLTDFSSNQLYLGAFPGFLYEGSNDPPSDHLADGLRFAQMIVPLDAQGRPSASGKIVVPWLGWGPYFWAGGNQPYFGAGGNPPRSDGLVWLPSDFASDGTHPSISGINKVATMMMKFYLNSDLTPWFR